MHFSPDGEDWRQRISNEGWKKDAPEPNRSELQGSPSVLFPECCVGLEHWLQPSPPSLLVYLFCRCHSSMKEMNRNGKFPDTVQVSPPPRKGASYLHGKVMRRSAPSFFFFFLLCHILQLIKWKVWKLFRHATSSSPGLRWMTAPGVILGEQFIWKFC